MRIGIDISQIVHQGTGVARYVREMVKNLVTQDERNRYILFGSSLRKQEAFHSFFRELSVTAPRVQLVVVPIPPALLDLLWNRFHILPVEWFTGSLDVFWSSDWTQPPLRGGRGVTTIHDLTVLTNPECFDRLIVQVQRRRLKWAVKECSTFLCDSLATKEDAVKLLHIDPGLAYVVYPGISS